MQDIRNIAILAHIDAGKTTLSERILWTAGKILRPGNVEDGLATMDYLPEEKAKGITIEAGISYFEWRDIWWNLIDAPGHIDFGMEADTALQAADGAVLVVSALDGIQPQTFAAWEKLKLLNKPCIIFFNKTDLPESRLEESFLEIEEQFGVKPLLMNWPVKNEGVWDVLSGCFLKHNAEGKEDIFDFTEEKEEMENYRREACEAASLADDKILEKMLAKKQVETSDLLAGLQKLFCEKKHILCYAGSAKKNIGIRSLLNGISFFIKPQTIMSKELGQVIRYRFFSGIGEVAIFKSFKKLPRSKFPSGLKFYRIHAQNLSEVQEIFCGDIYAIKGMEHKKTGDYTPLLQMRIECLKAKDWEATNAALKSIERTDNSVKVSDNSDGSWTLHAMGAVQFDFILSRLKREFRSEVRAGEPSVEFREMLSKKLEATQNFCQIGDTSVKISLSAEPNSSGFAVEGSEKKWRDVIISALDEFCQSGVLGKGSLWNVKFILHKFEVQGSSQAVIKKACLDAAKMLVEPSSVQIYEPWVNLTVQCPSLFAGTVTSDLLSRGAKIINSDGDGKKARFYAEAPLSKLARYTTELLSITKGGGNFFLHYLKHKEFL
ncbi:MAG: TetM/TetW/TetO/TetS family tetracycline resistance ribosomal protection protein [Fibromonadaceae bacterium]|jgi:elongation factor G|nr:TetM/TetW/TetO/TetS family tetracycline resistance ribosomal protection protein [Fibromonadaceae bacterium]